jgi:hypothetical protein
MRIRKLLCALSIPVVAACGANSAGSATDDVGTTAQAVETSAAKAQDEGGERDHERGEQFKHIFVIMMENHATDEIIGNLADAPYINQLAARHAVATNYFGVTHPSLPNYLAAISGSYQGIFDDCKAGADVTCAPEEFVPGSGDATDGNLLTPKEIASASTMPHWFAGKNLVDQLEKHDLSWKAYMQSMPEDNKTVEYAPLDPVTGSPIKLYAQKHNPFMYFSDIRNDAARMKRVVGLGGLEKDLASGRVPNFVWISPDQCHDMHGVSPDSAVAVGFPSCGYPDSGLDHGAIALGDAFLKDTVTKIMHSPVWGDDSAIVIAWDEDDYAGYAGCCESPRGVNGVVLGGANAPALVITSHARAMTSKRPFNHYSLLATIEQLWGLGCLGEACKISGAGLMTDLFAN